ncbi:sensor histidine kinase [Chryseolinea lacunae]|uniref:Histidine kinase n=1 Tax=Chryseolinea lacunae TaxID=2801331 RepID=A0ABS1KLI5_9BACT|nr:histidine kinase [Chryseolinea lacunae]MBL0740320.1 histidine kinase [Chryseolinea lacunae]
MQTNLTTSRVILATFGWCSMLVLFETYALMSTFSFDLTVALADSVNFNLLVFTAGYVMFNTLKFYQPAPKNGFYLLVWSVALASLCAVLHRYAMAHYFFQDNVAYQEYLVGSHVIRGLFAWLFIALIGMQTWIWFYIQDQRASEKREQETLKFSREAELASLRQQLQPHFLFNSLNSISALAGSRPEEARKMIQQLSDFLRGTIKKDDQQLVSLEEELKHLQLYLDIEKVRFGHRLKTEIISNENTATMVLPALLLQPVVENAIKFGLYDTIGEITIRIQARSTDRNLIIVVENPFDPETSHPRQGTGFGLNSVQRRLSLLYARQDLLTTQAVGTLFRTEIKIPQPA